MSEDLSILNLSRRTLFKATGALVLGFHLPNQAMATSFHVETAGVPLNAWLKISADAVTVLVGSSEMGQGVFTALPMLVAEELDVPWQSVRAEMAPFAAAYFNPMLGTMLTGGSTSVRGGFLPLRRAGAAARVMLMAAAAQLWRIPLAEVTAQNAVVSHPPTDRQASYGALARRASHQPVPLNPPLRDRSQWTRLGRSLPRLDIPAKVTGKAMFGLDVRLPGMVYAAIRHCPVLGGSLGKSDDSALKIKTGSGFEPGIMAVVPFKDAIAVVAETWWQARAALARITVAWTEGSAATLSSPGLEATFLEATDFRETHGVVVAVSRGEPDQALKTAARVVDAVYRLPFLAHATLEPMNCTASVNADGCELWVPTQDQSRYGRVLPEMLGLKPEQIKVNTTFVGGGFGRRVECDFGVEAALLAKAIGRPVQLIWTREEDIRHDYYRPASASRVALSLDATGRLTGWHHRVVSGSVLGRTGSLKDGLDPGAVGGIADQPYTMPNLRLEYVRQECAVPLGFWRAAGHGSNAFVVESMLDEAAANGRRDPYLFRRDLLAQAHQALAVLDQAARMVGWSTPLPEIAGARRGRGLALHESFGSIVAQVVEVTVDSNGHLTIDRVVGVINCGTVIHPDNVIAQMEGAILFGLSAALTGKVTIDKGRVLQSNFHDHPLLTLAQTPPIEIHLMPDPGPPSGVGEPGLPPIAPALTNAIFAATGRRLRSLPVMEHDLRSI